MFGCANDRRPDGRCSSRAHGSATGSVDGGAEGVSTNFCNATATSASDTASRPSSHAIQTAERSQVVEEHLTVVTDHEREGRDAAGPALRQDAGGEHGEPKDEPAESCR